MIVPMMNQEQTSSAVYGVFFDVFFDEDYEGQVLMGLYTLEGEAEAARDAYIASEMKMYSLEGYSQELERLREHVVVRRLALGQVPRYDFSL
jgi:hypothetical protein